MSQRVLVDVDAEAGSGGDGDVCVGDGDLLGRDLLAILERAHEIGRVGEVGERRGEVQAHGGGDAHLDHAADHHADARRCGDLGRLEGGCGAAELGNPYVDDGGAALA